MDIGIVVLSNRNGGGHSASTVARNVGELMLNNETGQIHTAHTTNPVPLIYIGRPANFIIDHGALSDIAPTMLYLMGLQAPNEMNGKILLELTEQDTAA